MRNKNLKFKRIYSTLSIGFLFFGLIGCNSKTESDPWSNFNSFEDGKLASNVELYYDESLGYKTENQSTFDVYTEMSMDFGYMAYKMDYNKTFAGDIFFEMNKIHHYKIEKAGVVDNGILEGKDEIMNKIDNPSVYKSTGVDIEVGLKQLVENNRPSLIITDFELWDENKGTELYSNAIYSEQFKKWLERPNHSITFYYANFCDEAKDKEGRVGEGSKIIPERFHKKIFFAFFDVDKNKTFSTKSLPVSIPSQFQKVVVDIAPYKVSTKYASLEGSGIGMGLNSGVTKVVQGLPKNKSFEFINVGKYTWEYLDKLIQTKKTEPFLKNLFIDASDNAAFDLEKVGVHVVDVTEDFTFFTRCNYAKTLKPKIIQDKNGKDVFDVSNDAITKFVYNPSTKLLNKEWLYGISTSKKGTEIHEILDVNNELVKNTKAKSAKKIEIETKIHSTYRLDKIKQKNGLLRIDIIAEDATKNYASFENLVWDSQGSAGVTGKYKNTSLSKSIQSALKDLQAGQIIYSYYLRVQPSK